MRGDRTNGHSYGGSSGSECIFCQQPTISRPLRTAEDILACLEFFRDKKQEFLICLSVDGNERLILRRIVTIGLLDVSLVGIREVFAGPLTDRARAIILAHNHPSGIAEPSNQDIKTTQQLAAAGVLLGIPLREHLIVTKTGYFSFQEQGLIGN